MHIHICGVMECMSSLLCNLSRISLHFKFFYFFYNIWSPLTWPPLQFCPWCFGTGMASRSLLPECLHSAFEILRIWEFENLRSWKMYLFLPGSSPGEYLGSLNYVEALRPPPHSWNPPVIENIRWIWHNHSSPFVYIVEKICQKIQTSVTLTNPSAPALALVVPRQMNAESTLQTKFVFLKRHPVSFQRIGCSCFQEKH